MPRRGPEMFSNLGIMLIEGFFCPLVRRPKPFVSGSILKEDPTYTQSGFECPESQL